MVLSLAIHGKVVCLFCVSDYQKFSQKTSSMQMFDRAVVLKVSTLVKRRLPCRCLTEQ